MTVFEPYYWRVILDTTGGKVMLGLFLADLFLIVESFIRRSLWQGELTGVRKRLIVLRSSAILLPLLGVSAYVASVGRSFDALRVVNIAFDTSLLADGIYRILSTSFTGLWMGIFILICLTILEIRAEAEKAKSTRRPV